MPADLRETPGRIALIAGASGLVGGHLLQLLLAGTYYGQIISVGRRPLAFQHPRLQQIITDFDSLPDLVRDLKPDDVFCCLGTTIKKAGSQEAFRKVDLEYPLALARQTALLPQAQFLLVTAMGADAGSAFFYNRVKGELEGEVTRLPIYSFHSFRPSLLLGSRAEQRTGEKLAQAILPAFSFLLRGPLRHYRPVQAEIVAADMLQAARQRKPGRHIHLSGDLTALACSPV